MKYRIFALLLCVLYLSACSQKVIQITKIKDLEQLPQDALIYIDESSQIKVDSKALAVLKNDYLEKYYSIWQEKPNPNVNEVFWIKPSLLKNPGFGENLQANPLSYTKEILDSMDIESYPSKAIRAIITTTTDVRAVPTIKPMFNKPDGYPFDRWQNSLIFVGTPVLITHTSRDKSWVHIQSSFVYGWVKAEHVGILSKEQIKEIRGFKQYVTPIEDKILLYNAKGDFATQARIGQIFALKTGSHTKGDKIALVTYTRMPNGNAKQKILYALKSHFSPFPLELDTQNIAKTINAMLGQRYGWGGLLENRECSAFVRDIFSQYGIHLPRNSKAQVNYGKNSVDLSTLTREEKEAFIIANATPYQTLLWQSGHIMLYIGHFEGKALIAHSVWSVTTGKKYENMLGGVVITTLHVGEEHNGTFAKSPLLIDKIGAMSDLSILAKQIQAK